MVLLGLECAGTVFKSKWPQTGMVVVVCREIRGGGGLCIRQCGGGLRVGISLFWMVCCIENRVLEAVWNGPLDC